MKKSQPKGQESQPKGQESQPKGQESRLKRVLSGIEHFSITVAAIAGTLTLIQYFLETDDRKIDRAANFVLAFQACEIFSKEAEELVDLRMKEAGLRLEKIESALSRFLKANDKSQFTPEKLLLEESASEFAKVFEEIRKNFRRLEIEAVMKTRLREGVSRECKQIHELNES